MALTLEAEQKSWDCDPMIEGKIYQTICCRDLLAEQDLQRIFGDENITIDKRVDYLSTHVVYLSKIIIEHTFGNEQKAYQTFIKVLTDQGHCGWIIWFEREWQEVQQCQ